MTKELLIRPSLIIRRENITISIGIVNKIKTKQHFLGIYTISMWPTLTWQPNNILTFRFILTILNKALTIELRRHDNTINKPRFFCSPIFPRTSSKQP